MLMVQYIDARSKTVYLHNSWHPTERDPQSRPHSYSYLTLGYGSRQQAGGPPPKRPVEMRRVLCTDCEDTFREGRDIDVCAIGPTFERGEPCHKCNSTFAPTTLEIRSPTRKDIAALEMEQEEGTAEIEHPRDTGPGKRRTQGGRRRRRR